MKLDIENRILIPFMILSILPITLLGIFSYMNGYQLLMNDKIKNLETSLKESVAYLELVDSSASDSATRESEMRSKVTEFFSTVPMREQIIIEDDRVILNITGLTGEDLAVLPSEQESGVYDGKDFLLVYDSFTPWNWKLVMAIDKTRFTNELLEIQKYIILVAIIFLVLSMQAIIFTAHSISRPIRQFAELCRTLEIGNLKQKISMNRKDEIGVLASAFNGMIDQLNSSAEGLMAMQRFNENILSSVSVGILTTDPLGNRIALNKSGEDILDSYGHDPQIVAALNAQIRDTIHTGKNLNAIAKVSLTGGKALFFDVGTSLLKQENSAPTGAICCFSDITQRRVLENNIVRVNRLASVGQFAAGLAHEIRNPLTGLKTGLQVISNRLNPEADSSSLELAEGMSYELDRINSLVTELLDFSKPRQAQRQKVDLVQLLRKSLDITADALRQKRVNLQLALPEKKLYAFVDRGQTEQIFINIIANAVDAMDEGGTLAIAVEDIQSEGDRWSRIAFADDGHGIPPELMEKIFDPFFTTKSKGIGLGLSVVSSLVAENFGKLEIKSSAGSGATIAVSLPEFREDTL